MIQDEDDDNTKKEVKTNDNVVHELSEDERPPGGKSFSFFIF